MPTYFARGVTVRLGAQPLAETVTPKIVLKKGDIAKAQCEKAEKKLLGSELLHERRVNFANDHAGFELNWLGGAPFMQVKTGGDLFEESSDGCWKLPTDTINPSHLWRAAPTNSNQSDRVRSKDDALAISLHVKLSDTTFISGLDSNNKVHLKIDVFFNGELSSCLFVPLHDIRSKAKTYHQLFAGHRIDYLAERPWVIVSNHKGDSSGCDTKEPCLPVAKRWDEICRALGREADKRGQDKNGNMPPTAEFLKALATMQMPHEVQGMQSSGKKTFGIIDVVITAGDGRKLTSNVKYLKAPQRMADESYPIVPDTGKGEEFGPAKENDAAAGVPGAMATKNTMDLDADGESDSEYEPPAKRRAIAPQVVSLRGEPIAQIPVLSCSNSMRKSSSSPVKISNGNSSIPALGYQSFARGSAASPERGQARQLMSTGHKKPDMPRVPLAGTPQSFPTFSSSSFGHAHAPQVPSSPYSYHSSTALLGLAESPTMPMTFATPGDMASWSSPVPQPYGSASRMPHSQLPSLNHVRGPMAMGVSSSLPELPRRGSTSSIAGSHFSAPASLGYRFSAHDRRPFASFDSPASLSHMASAPLPFDKYSRESLGGLPLQSSPYERRFSLPQSLPPMGMFSVPTKPRLSQSSTKGSRSASPNKRLEKLAIKRLIIMGSGVRPIVDHLWSTPQIIVLGKDRDTMHSTDTSPLSSLNSSMFSNTSLGSSMTSQPSSKTTAHTETSITASQSQSLKAAFTAPRTANTLLRAPKVETGDKLSYSSDLSSPPSFAEDRKDSFLDASGTVKMRRLPFKGVQELARAVAGSAVPQRRVSANNNILGVQGPKATTFWLEDPEEVLREAARLRRAKASNRRKRDPVCAVEHTTVAPVNSALDACIPPSSSPLSTAPSSPESTSGPEALKRPTADIIQLDGAGDRKSSKPSRLKTRTPSPTKKLTAFTTPDLPPMTPSTPQTSPSSVSKKRKAMGRCLPKTPRSPDRLKTVGNPPLNQGCVIAFAESEEGVLRQVKGERLGIFKEEYVVLATRFFIPGG